MARMSRDLRGRPFDPAGERPHYFTDSLWGFELKDAAGPSQTAPEWLRVSSAANAICCDRNHHQQRGI